LQQSYDFCFNFSFEKLMDLRVIERNDVASGSRVVKGRGGCSKNVARNISRSLPQTVNPTPYRRYLLSNLPAEPPRVPHIDSYFHKKHKTRVFIDYLEEECGKGAALQNDDTYFVF
jgi:hypothetical protein